MRFSRFGVNDVLCKSHDQRVGGVPQAAGPGRIDTTAGSQSRVCGTDLFEVVDVTSLQVDSVDTVRRRPTAFLSRTWPSKRFIPAYVALSGVEAYIGT